MSQRGSGLGPIELEVLRNALTAAAAEMDVTIWRTSSVGTPANVARKASREYGYDPSTWGKSPPHMILSTPIWWRRLASVRCRKLAPMNMFRLK